MTDLQRITTEYIVTEDRVRISGLAPDGSVDTLWLTQRLLVRLIPHLLGVLEKTVSSDDRTRPVVQGFAQQAAVSGLNPEPAVRPDTTCHPWLAAEAQVSHSDTRVILRLQDGQGHMANLVMDHRQLRQWLAMVLALWRKAQWPMTLWPEWMLEGTPQAATAKAPLH